MDAGTLDRLMAARRARRPVVLATDLASGRQCLIDGEETHGTLPVDDLLRQRAAAALRSDRGETVERDGTNVFLHPFNPPLRMAVVGAVHIAQALAPMAALAGYDVTIVDPRESFATTERFPNVSITHDWPDDALDAFAPDTRSAVVTLTHDPKLDDPALLRALASPCFYIGALGSTRTHAARLARLAKAGAGEEVLARINGPIGLAIGAQSPAEIAISILGQVTETLRRPDAART